MKKIELKSLPESEQGKGDGLDYKVLLRTQLGLAPAGGLTVAEIAYRLNLISEIDAAGDAWLISDQLHADLTKTLEQERFTAVTPNLLLFISDMKNAQSVENK